MGWSCEWKLTIQRETERYNACLSYQPPQSPTRLAFLIKVDGLQQLNRVWFGLLLVEAAAVISTFPSFEDWCSLLFRFTARLICSLGDANAKTKRLF